ncbi:class II aldolase/adducin family protein [Pseudomonas sp. J452]|uniref:class II aldolase/adducin family protein n=1 Tax=Pseudomonas sp. J452 TaxID=2898441 RepID=UPI0021ADBB0C|nr:class II aldolase/adducin family protein [Pseudomonas sp. J452]UUY08648.1 class II aldolase/adducin family protein [Pseudomonas sp. J452]
MAAHNSGDELSRLALSVEAGSKQGRTPAADSQESLRLRVSDEEWQARVDLAAAFRLVALFGWDDLVFTHLSVRIPGPEHHFLINPYDLLFEEVTASSLVKINVEGEPVEETPYLVNAAGFTIHSAVHMAREDAKAVIHLHTRCGQAVSGMEDGLLPLTQTAMIAHHDLAFHEYEGIATDLDERERLVRDLGDKNLMLLRNHGTLAVGESMAVAFSRMYFLERACEAQVAMLSAGADRLHEPPLGVRDKVREQSRPATMRMAGERLIWPALLRKLDRLDPSYRT